MGDMKRNDSPASKTRAASRSGAAASSPPSAPAGTPPDPRAPSSFPRRVLLACTGLSPQIVTETLYALAVEAEDKFVPTEIVLLTTKEGKERARLSLLSEDPGWFYRLMRDYQLPAIAFDETAIRVLTGPDGQPLDDIRTEADNERAADLIVETVRSLTADPHSAVHASIAGGRKTMGFYLGYALSLYGRPQDRLSHVLVSEPFESSWDFFYPTPYERIIQTRSDKLANCRDAQVALAEIPFVRLREGLPERLLSGAASFSDSVAAAGRALLAPKLVLVPARATVFADDERIELSPTEFLLLWWFAERAREETEKEVIWSDPSEAMEILDLARRLWPAASGEYERLEKALKSCKDDPKAFGDYFEPHKSRINKAFEEALGHHAAQRYAIQRAGRRGKSRYFLPLAPDQIEIRE